MQPVATDAVWPVCLYVTMAELFEMPFGSE